jgi:hypothetical protein
MSANTNKKKHRPANLVEQALAAQEAAKGRVAVAQAAVAEARARLNAATPEGVAGLPDHTLEVMIRNTEVELRPILGHILDLRLGLRRASATLEAVRRDLGRANGNVGRAKGLLAAARRHGGAFGKVRQID